METKEPEQDRPFRDLVSQLAVVIRTSQLHNPANEAVVTAIEKLIPLINGLLEDESSIQVELVGEYFYVNENRVKFTMEHLLNFDFLQKEFAKRSVGSISFLCPVAVENIQNLLSVFIACQYAPDPFEALVTGLAQEKCIDAGVVRRISVDGEHDLRKAVKKTYFNAVSFTKGVMNKLKAGERVNIKKAKRIVESMVDLLLDREEFLLGMTAIKNYDEYTFHHSVNVSILSVALGQKIGLSKKDLMELGLAALFHDIGKTEIPPLILNKPTSFTDEEWNVLKGHPVHGVRMIFRMKSFDDSSIRAAIVAYEHHMHQDHSGYPGIKKLKDLDLYSRIVSLADQYDGMTSSRVYARVPMTPDKALSLMSKRAGVQLDPLLFKFFINLVGVYPIGSLIMLDTRELAVISGVNNGDFQRPKMILITDGEGNKITPVAASLTEKDGLGRYTRNVMRTLDPVKYKINIAEYLL